MHQVQVILAFLVDKVCMTAGTYLALRNQFLIIFKHKTADIFSGRLMAIAGLPPIGCLPIQIVTRYRSSGNLACLEDQNSDCQTYYKKLGRLLTQLQPSLPGSRFLYADIYDPLSDMVSQPQNTVSSRHKEGAAERGLSKPDQPVTKSHQHVEMLPGSCFGMLSIQAMPKENTHSITLSIETFGMETKRLKFSTHHKDATSSLEEEQDMNSQPSYSSNNRKAL
ncbi:hypothetical protein SADUNF_Sadunf13G0118600 [Salix dunnii]|uniref:Uncharacterized protein n=1 Tax=Salix dunnii TaxID=1413687 RepID=A0A835JM21_9ROSI|nr:hypothetical protein SADUNF_Sadunf13G0118600 [Salix dunnii]